MRRSYNEDLFRDTTMTFGEHLEELRACLFKSILGLAVGFVLGLLVGKYVVRFIQVPLENALTSYYQKQSVEKIESELDQFRQAGYTLPGDPDVLAEFVAKRNLMPEEVYVNAEELARQLEITGPKGPKHVAAPPGSQGGESLEGDLVRVFIWRPIEDGTRATSLSPHEPFLIYIKASLVLGVLIASPWIFYQIWSFVAAGLYPHEKKYIHVFLPFSLGLFLAGAATAFFFVFEPVLYFLFSFNDWLGITPDLRIQEWLSFVLILPLGFGISFQLPLVMLFLERIGIFDVQGYLSKWRIAVLVIAVLSMFLTPADPYSMILMGAPLTVLYFGGILLCKYMPRNRSPFDDDLEEPKEARETDPAAKPRRGLPAIPPRIVIAALLAVLLAAGWFPLRKARQQKASVDKIENFGGKVYYDYQVDPSGKPIDGAKPPGPGVLRWLFGKDLLATVSVVDLSDCPVGDDDLKPIEALSGLTRLDVTETTVTEQGVERLRQALPECEIVYRRN